MRDIRLYGTTNGTGDLTVTSTESANGLLFAVQLIDGALADGVDITLTCEQGDYSIPLLTLANFNSDQIVLPRVLEASNTDGSALTTRAMLPVIGRPKMVLAQGGATVAGGCILYIIEM